MIEQYRVPSITDDLVPFLRQHIREHMFLETYFSGLKRGNIDYNELNIRNVVERDILQAKQVIKKGRLYQYIASLVASFGVETREKAFIKIKKKRKQKIQKPEKIKKSIAGVHEIPNGSLTSQPKQAGSSSTLLDSAKPLPPLPELRTIGEQILQESLAYHMQQSEVGSIMTAENLKEEHNQIGATGISTLIVAEKILFQIALLPCMRKYHDFERLSPVDLSQLMVPDQTPIDLKTVHNKIFTRQYNEDGSKRPHMKGRFMPVRFAKDVRSIISISLEKSLKGLGKVWGGSHSAREHSAG